MSLKDDARKLREQAERRRHEAEFEDATEGYSAPQKTFYEGGLISPEHEVYEFVKHLDAGQAAGNSMDPIFATASRYWPWPIDPEKDPEGAELYERIMRRASPELADEAQVRRDVPWRRMVRLGMDGAAFQRHRAITADKAPLITTEEEADDYLNGHHPHWTRYLERERQGR